MNKTVEIIVSALAGAIASAGVGYVGERSWAWLRTPRLLYTEVQENWRAPDLPQHATITLINPSRRPIEGLKVTLTPKWRTAVTSVKGEGNDDFTASSGSVAPQGGVLIADLPQFSKDSKYSIYVSSADMFRLGKNGVTATANGRDVSVTKLTSELYLRSTADRAILLLIGAIGGLAGGVTLLRARAWFSTRERRLGEADNANRPAAPA
jgi:hypothetical protein